MFVSDQANFLDLVGMSAYKSFQMLPYVQHRRPFYLTGLSAVAVESNRDLVFAHSWRIGEDSNLWYSFEHGGLANRWF